MAGVGLGVARGLTALVWGLSLVLALYVGRRIERRSARADQSAVDSARETVGARFRPGPIFVSAGRGTDPDELRRIVREELAADRRAGSPASEQTPSPKPAGVESLTPEAQARLRDVASLVDQALTNRRWTRDDRQKWLALMHQPGVPAAAFNLQLKLTAAINRGEIVVDAGGPPFSPFIPQH